MPSLHQRDYRAFAHEVLAPSATGPFLQVLADDFPTNGKSAREIATWGLQMSCQIPVTNTKSEGRPRP